MAGMNLLILRQEDFLAPGRVRITGRRLRHVTEVHRAAAGDRAGGGPAGRRPGPGPGDPAWTARPWNWRWSWTRPPPPKLPLTLVLALPRPKVLNRVLAAATSLGVARIYLVNAWKVEKSYWKQPAPGRGEPAAAAHPGPGTGPGHPPAGTAPAPPAAPLRRGRAARAVGGHPGAAGPPRRPRALPPGRRRAGDPGHRPRRRLHPRRGRPARPQRLPARCTWAHGSCGWRPPWRRWWGGFSRSLTT